MRFSFYLAAALVAVTSNAIDLQSADIITKVQQPSNTEGDMWKMDEKGHWYNAKNMTKAQAKPIEKFETLVQQRIREFKEM